MKMNKENTTKEDGRYLIYYTFEEEKDKIKKENDKIKKTLKEGE